MRRKRTLQWKYVPNEQPIEQFMSNTCLTLHSFWWFLYIDYVFSDLVVSTIYVYDDVIKWKYFPRYWPFVWRIHRFPVNSPHKGQWRGALMFSLICVWINDWVNNGEPGDLRGYRIHYDVTVMSANIILCSRQVLTRDSMKKVWTFKTHC